MTRRPVAAVAMVAATGLLLSIATVWAYLSAPPAGRQDRTGVAGRAASPASERVPEPVSEPAVPPDSGVGRPVRVAAPAIRLDAPVVAVGVSADGRMRLPDDPAVLGWYRFGPAPGAPGGGSVVFAGHVDSREYGVGPLVRLRDARVGDRVVVTGPGGVRSTYVVEGVRRYDRRALPDSLFARSGPERLRLVTCDGPFVPDRGGYQQNLVVTAVPR